MADQLPETSPSVSALIGSIIDDFQRLIRQEIALARREITEEWTKTKMAAGLAAGGIISLGIALLMFSFMLVMLIRTTGLAEWACFGIVCGIFVVLGAIGLGASIAYFQQVHVVPPRTAQTLREDLRAVTPGNQAASHLARH
jgi:protein-S-isoprenylcysteine O-methyltransferase Ste14